jgi:hypothetical protein
MVVRTRWVGHQKCIQNLGWKLKGRDSSGELDDSGRIILKRGVYEDVD